MYYVNIIEEIVNSSNFTSAKCNQYNFFLALFHSSWWLLWFGKFFYLFVMLFFCLGLTKNEEFLMSAIEKITAQKIKKKIKNSTSFIQHYVERKLWSNVFADLTLRALGSNSFEIIFPFTQLIFNASNESNESIGVSLLIVIKSIFKLFIKYLFI